MLMLWRRDGDGMLVVVSLWLVGTECENDTEKKKMLSGYGRRISTSLMLWGRDYDGMTRHVLGCGDKVEGILNRDE